MEAEVQAYLRLLESIRNGRGTIIPTSGKTEQDSGGGHEEGSGEACANIWHN